MTITRREIWGSALALGSGMTIAIVDSRPTWDDTGITAAALVASAALAAMVTGRRPWLIALLVGLPTPLLEVPTRGQAVRSSRLLLQRSARCADSSLRAGLSRNG